MFGLHHKKLIIAVDYLAQVFEVKSAFFGKELIHILDDQGPEIRIGWATLPQDLHKDEEVLLVEEGLVLGGPFFMSVL